MRNKKILVTERRLMWLRKLESANQQTGYFIRDFANGVVRHTLSHRRMSQIVYMWLIEHHLVDVDACGNIHLTPKGKSVLEEAIEVNHESK